MEKNSDLIESGVSSERLVDVFVSFNSLDRAKKKIEELDRGVNATFEIEKVMENDMPGLRIIVNSDIHNGRELSFFMSVHFGRNQTIKARVSDGNAYVFTKEYSVSKAIRDISLELSGMIAKLVEKALFKG